LRRKNVVFIFFLLLKQRQKGVSSDVATKSKHMF
jgi:hypothetical protein